MFGGKKAFAAGAVLCALAASVGAEDKTWRAIPKGKAVEYKGKKYVNVYQNGLYIGLGDYDLREYDGDPKAGKKICGSKEVHGLVLTWEKQEPDKFKNKVVKTVLFFLNDKGGGDDPSGPIAGEEEDKKLFAQKYPNSMFAIEADEAEGAPKQVVDLNDPPQWKTVWGFAVYSNGEWKPTAVRAKADSWKGPKEGEYDKNAIMLPENYNWPG